MCFGLPAGSITIRTCAVFFAADNGFARDVRLDEKDFPVVPALDCASLLSAPDFFTEADVFLSDDDLLVIDSLYLERTKVC